MLEPTDEALLHDYQRRTRELEALFETAGDLSALRDVDRVLQAIVRRSRQLLGSDVAYLMLLDDARQEAYMRIGEGIQTPEFLDIRLAYGEGLGGLVADTGMPQWTSDYHGDLRFAPSIDSIVRDESLQAIVGVPLKVRQKVTGVLFASDRRRRSFTHDEVSLLSSLASHAAIALENASLFEASQQALHKWQDASERIEEHNRMLERAAELHETLTSLVLGGAPLPALADAVADGIGGRVVVLDVDGSPLTPGGDPTDLPRADQRDLAVSSGDASVELVAPSGVVVRLAPAQAGSRLLGHLVHAGAPLSPTDVRAFERAALVTALLLLDRRAHDVARVHAMAELVDELVDELGRGGGESRLRRRAESAGLLLPDPPYVALVALAQGGGPVSSARLEAAAQLASERGGLARVRGSEADLLLHGSDAGPLARDLAARLTEAHGGPVTVGAAGPEQGLPAAAGSLARARTCAKVLDTIGRRGDGATAEELGVYTLLFSEVGRDRIEEFVAEAIGPVQQSDAARGGQLMHTLATYFEVGGQTGKLADALFVHVNTLYQRLERVDRLLGPGWRRGEQSLQVHLAVRLARLLERAV